jgi:hypothetical protein
MDIDVPLRELGPVNSQPLIDTVLGAPEAAWREQNYRQEEYEVHKQTESLVMIFCDGWPDMKISKEPAWELLKDVAVPLMRDIIETHYEPGGNVIRAMAAKLKAGAVISPHWDSHESFMVAHRIHVPITTNPGVRFMINGRPYRFKVGEAYEINNQKNHSVMNSGSEDRITFIFDYLPPKSQ